MTIPTAVLGLPPDQSTAFFALVGVLIGGVLNYFVSRALERRGSQLEGRVAARLVQGELRANGQSLARALEGGDVGGPVFQREQWESNRAALARVVSDDAWEALLTAYMGIGAGVPDHPNDWPSAYDMAHEESQRAAAALEPYKLKRRRARWGPRRAFA